MNLPDWLIQLVGRLLIENEVLRREIARLTPEETDDAPDPDAA